MALQPTSVESLRDKRILHVAVGDSHVLCCDSEGSVRIRFFLHSILNRSFSAVHMGEQYIFPTRI